MKFILASVASLALVGQAYGACTEITLGEETGQVCYTLGGEAGDATRNAKVSLEGITGDTFYGILLPKEVYKLTNSDGTGIASFVATSKCYRYLKNSGSHVQVPETNNCEINRQYPFNEESKNLPVGRCNEGTKNECATNDQDGIVAPMFTKDASYKFELEMAGLEALKTISVIYGTMVSNKNEDLNTQFINTGEQGFDFDPAAPGTPTTAPTTVETPTTAPTTVETPTTAPTTVETPTTAPTTVETPTTAPTTVETPTTAPTTVETPTGAPTFAGQTGAPTFTGQTDAPTSTGQTGAPTFGPTPLALSGAPTAAPTDTSTGPIFSALVALPLALLALLQ